MGKTAEEVKSKTGVFKLDSRMGDVYIFIEGKWRTFGKIKNKKIVFDTLPMQLSPEELRELADFVQLTSEENAPATKRTTDDIIEKLKSLLPQRLFYELEITTSVPRSIVVCGTVKDIITGYSSTKENEDEVSNLLSDLLQNHFNGEIK